MEKDKRECRRLKINLDLQYKYFEGGKIYHSSEALVEDLSARGMSLVVDRNLESGQKLLVTLFLPPTVSMPAFLDSAGSAAGENIPVLALAEAVWCHREIADKYRVGVEFVFPELHGHGERFAKFLQAHQLNECVLLKGELPFAAEEA